MVIKAFIRIMQQLKCMKKKHTHSRFITSPNVMWLTKLAGKKHTHTHKRRARQRMSEKRLLRTLLWCNFFPLPLCPDSLYLSNPIQSTIWMFGQSLCKTKIFSFVWMESVHGVCTMHVHLIWCTQSVYHKRPNIMMTTKIFGESQLCKLLHFLSCVYVCLLFSLHFQFLDLS